MTAAVSTLYDPGVKSAPGAGVFFCTIPSASLSQAGEYRIRAQICYTGAALGAPEQSVANVGNVGLYLGNTLQVSAGMPAVSGILLPFQFLVVLDGSTSVQLGAIAAATASVLYWGILEADFLGHTGSANEFSV